MTRPPRRFVRTVSEQIMGAFRPVGGPSPVSVTVTGDQIDEIDGHPLAERLWVVLEDYCTRRPTPEAKLEQAERDVSGLGLRQLPGSGSRLPVVIWHRIRERTHQVTTRLWVLDELRFVSVSPRTLAARDCDTIVTLDLGAFVEILKAAVQR